MIDIKPFYKSLPNTVFISGGMSGIGAELAKSFMAAGSNVAIFDLQENAVVLAELKDLSTGNQVQVYQLDICHPDQVEQAVNNAVADIGRPALALNSAGILRTAPFKALTYDSFKKVMDINLMGSRNFAASVTPHMQQGDHLALVASLAGITVTYTHAAYSASKFAVVGLAEVLRLELKLEGVDVSVICPGEIATPLLEHERKHGSAVTARVNSVVGVLSVEQACRGILKGLSNRTFMITPGFNAIFMREFARKASSLCRKVTDILLAREFKRS